MLQPAEPNYAELSRLAFEIWRSLEGAGSASLIPNPPAAQKALKRYRECFKAVCGEDFDLINLP